MSEYAAQGNDYKKVGNKVSFSALFVSALITPSIFLFSWFTISSAADSFSWNLTPLNEVSRIIGTAIDTTIGLWGVLAVLLGMLIVAALYCYGSQNAMQNQMIEVAKHYAQLQYDGCDEIVAKWDEYKSTGVRQLDFYKVFNHLINCHRYHITHGTQQASGYDMSYRIG